MKTEHSEQAFLPAIGRWFERTFGRPTEAQERGWPVIRTGAHCLIAAPTGAGKTLAAFLSALNDAFSDALQGRLGDVTRVVYVSPLKALSNDVRKNLQVPLAGIREESIALGETPGEVRAEVRTGDTPAAARAALARRPPHLLVTTPESLYLLLTSESGRRLLRTVESVIVDEIHALVGNRRGSHLALSLERLAALTGRPLQRIGLSATQKPMSEVARFLTGSGAPGDKAPECVVVDCTGDRRLDLELELPKSPLDAVMSNEVWGEIYERLVELIEAHQTTLVFVNTRRLAERVTHQLGARLGADRVTSHHGSLSAELRLDAEDRLKQGKLRALVATASLELGIDIGSVDLVCQLGSTRSISMLLQRVGRAGHRYGGLPKGRLFPLSRDELIECAALVRCIRRGELDALSVPEKPLDILAQQIVAAAAFQEWGEEELFQIFRKAYPYRRLQREEFMQVVEMLAEGFSTQHGRRGALVHYDAVHRKIRGRRGARIVACTSGGAIADNADYRVVIDPSDTFIGSVNEDFALESMAGDVFQLGNASWRILRVNSGTVRVADAQGQPPSIPFWLGEAPARSSELSRAVSLLRVELGQSDDERQQALIGRECGLPHLGVVQLAEYLGAARRALGAIPSQELLVMERFFDESGGMQLVIHTPFGSRMNRAWGLALRKRFCRTFNFELQAAATEDAIVLSLGTQHSFPLDEVFRYLHSASVRDLLIQALLDAPMFTIRWRWNVARALAVPRQRGGRRVPPALQRMDSENLLASVFPDQLACLENIAGDRQIPDHPLVRQTIDDCLEEAMDVDRLIHVLQALEQNRIATLARDLPEPSPLAHEILNARPYAFLDNAPLEERRTRAVQTRRALQGAGAADALGQLDEAAIVKVQAEVWPRVENPDELHDALQLLVVLSEDEIREEDRTPWCSFFNQLLAEGRACQVTVDGPDQARRFWVSAERWPLVRAVFPEGTAEPTSVPPERSHRPPADQAAAIVALLRGRLEVSGPVRVSELRGRLGLEESSIEGALIALESQGCVLRGRFFPRTPELEWCDRNLLARIHRLTLYRLRAEIEPVSLRLFCRFLAQWQRVDPDHRAEGQGGVAAVAELLDGFEAPAAAWEPELLLSRVREFHPEWLDQLCFSGRLGWGRLTPPASRTSAGPGTPIRTSPTALFLREHLPVWLALAPSNGPVSLGPDTVRVWETLRMAGALFFDELVRRADLLPTRVEQALGELAALGRISSDSFMGLRALLAPARKRPNLMRTDTPRRHHTPACSVEFAGRWVALDRAAKGDGTDGSFKTGERSAGWQAPSTEAVECFARVLLRRYGVVFRRLIEHEIAAVSWFDLVRVYRALEARGEIRGGYFIAGVSGEQFALPEAVGLLRSLRKTPSPGKLVAVSAADPLNLTGELILGRRVAGVIGNRLLLKDGFPVAVLEKGKIERFEADEALQSDVVVERMLRIGKLPEGLRPYYA